MADPKCPQCQAAGIDKIVATPSNEKARDNTPWYYVAHCDECGHIYGVFPKHTFGKSGPNLVVEGRK